MIKCLYMSAVTLRELCERFERFSNLVNVLDWSITSGGNMFTIVVRFETKKEVR